MAQWHKRVIMEATVVGSPLGRMNYYLLIVSLLRSDNKASELFHIKLEIFYDSSIFFLILYFYY